MERDKTCSVTFQNLEGVVEPRQNNWLDAKWPKGNIALNLFI